MAGAQCRGVDIPRRHRVLIRLHDELDQRGIALCFARLKGRQREIFEETGLTARIGPDRLFPTVRAAVAAFESAHAGDAQ